MKILLFLFALILSVGMNAQTFGVKFNLDSIRGEGGGEVIYPVPSSEVYTDSVYTISGIVINNEGYSTFGLVEVNGEMELTNKEGVFTIQLNKNKPTEISISSPLQSGRCITFVADQKYNNKTFVVKLPKDDGKKTDTFIRKPAIYLYPETKQEVSIVNHFKGQIHTTFPVYNISDGWTVVANKDGKIYNPTDKHSYNYLFWDGKYTFDDKHYNFQSGFYVEKTQYSSFLRDKLSKVGLNETEINDFIVYWLPIMNNYEKVFIHFWINDDIDGSSQLVVTPKPDTMIRLFMEFKAQSGNGSLPEQVLPTIQRKKFTLVEWGGAEIGSREVK